MEFINVNRETAENLELDYPFILISITDPDSREAEIKSNPVDILRLSFHDLDKGEIDNPKYILFNEDDAKKILEFVKKHDVSLCIVHCEAGISRSAGVAAALTVIDGKKDNRFFKEFYPNRLVYSTILKEAGFAVDYKDYEFPAFEEDNLFEN